MSLDDALNTFIIESRELLEQMEDALLRIEQTPDDGDTINAIFRAAHTIKGSAGLFGLDHVVSFTHAAESVLDKVRGGELHISSELVALFLSVGDHLGTLIDHVSDGSEASAETHQASAALIARLGVYLDAPQPVSAAAPPAGRDWVAVEGAETGNWHISLRFSRDVLRNGMDPLAFIRYLGTFGRIEHIVTLADTVPRLANLDPESSYLGFEIAYRSDVDGPTIDSAFEFVRDDAQIAILPPHSKLSEYLALIDELPEDETRLGEIFVRCGTLTQSELDDGLRQRGMAPAQAPRQAGDAFVEWREEGPRVVEAAPDKQLVRDSKSAEGRLIRINAEKLDEHINLIGELIIASASTGLIAQRANIPDLFEAAARLARLVEEVRDSAFTLRMVQIGATLNKFQRVVHDMSAELNKDIRLEIAGAETELDKTVVEKIGDPLTHLVRNSLDHGIEPAEVRVAAGKPAHGTIRLNAFHDSGSIVIEVSDDGGGLNKERILRKAIERGIVKPEQQLGDAEIHSLIFEAGFSTAEYVNNISGRGVGMDVVRRNIDALRGSVEIDSVEGVGTTMRIRLPLTLAIIDGFLVGVGASSFVVPLEMVVECVELSSAETQAAQGGDHLNLRGEVLPFIRLRNLFEIAEYPPALGDAGAKSVGDSTAGSILAAESADALTFTPNSVKRENVVVVQYAGRRVGLVVEDLMGEFQTVIRPLGLVFNGIQGISGFTLLGSGQVALILDVPGLVRRVASNDCRRYADGAA